MRMWKRTLIKAEKGKKMVFNIGLDIVRENGLMERAEVQESNVRNI